MTLDVTATAYTGLGPGPHDVVVTGIERKQAKAGGDYMRWEFSDAEGNTTSANTSADLTPGNKTGRWYSALTGRVVSVGEAYSLADCIGKPGSIFIELNAEGYPKVISVTSRTVSPKRAKPVTEDIAKAGEAAAAIHAAQEGDDLPF